jgi:hypothetical protein
MVGMSARRRPHKSAPRTTKADEAREVARRSLAWTRRGAILTGLGIAVAVAIAAVSILITSNHGTPSQQLRSSSPFPGVMNAFNGPLFAVSIMNGFSACGPGGTGWVFPPSSARLLNSTPGTGIQRKGKTWDQDPQAFGAIPTSGEWMSITASDSSANAVVITNINIQVVSRRPAHGIVANFMPPHGCPTALFQTSSVNLDTSPPEIVPVQGNLVSPTGFPIKATPTIFPYTLTQSSPVAFLLIIYTQLYDCAWTAKIYWSDGSKAGATLIENHGRPFETSGTNLPTVTWMQIKGKWYNS